MGAAEMVPAEETVEALIECLVSPFLPRRSMSWDPPTIEQQKIVAKQMYAVVLLYNYYHRKLFPELEFLNFNSFCKMACISKPPLLNYMNAMYKSDMSSGDLDAPLSITEKMIMDACNVSLASDASKSVPNMEGWSITKVAVFLVDPSQEHCLLRSNGSTKVIIKSLVEKNLEMPLKNVADMRNELRSKSNVSGSLEGEFNDLEGFLQEVAFSSVKEQMGISHSNLSILGCYLSHSLNHMKSCTRLYIMSYAEPMDNQIPIKSVIQSLQGPLVKINRVPEVTGVIEYYRLLPYIDILSGWHSGKTSRSALQHGFSLKTDAVKKGSEGIVVIDIHEDGGDSCWSHGITNNNCSSKAVANNEIIDKNDNCPSPEDLSVSYKNAAVSSSTKKAVLSTVEEDVNEVDFLAKTEKNVDSMMSKKRKVKNVVAGAPASGHHYNADDSSTEKLTIVDGGNNEIIDKNNNCPSPEDLSVSYENAAVSTFTKKAVLSTVEDVNDVDFLALTEQNVDSMMSKKRKVKNVVAGSSAAAHHYNADDLSSEKLKTVYRDGETNLENAISHNSANKEKDGLNQVGGTMNHMIITLNSTEDDPLALSKKVDMTSVLQMLKKKRDELCHQQRLLEDNIAHCEMSIQTVLSGKDSSESKVEFMLKTCELICSNEMKNDADLFTKAQCQPQTISRKKLCDAVLHLQSPCQELDGIFCTNNWILPKYCVLPSSDGKFRAVVAVRGMDFECDSSGDCKSSPDKARASAAAHMLAKLRSMAAAQANE